MAKIRYIINPAASGWKGYDAWKIFQSQWTDPLDPDDVFITKRADQARQIAASSTNYEIIAVVGGDGTVGEILSGIFGQEGPRPKLAVIPAGTGNDVARSAGIFSLKDAVAALRGKHTREFDLIRVDCRVDGRSACRYAINAANVGFSPAFNRMLKPWMKRLFGPIGAYYLCAILGVITYRPRYMTAHWADNEYTGRTWMVSIGNAERVAGGSMCVAPGARTDDGELNVAIVEAQPKMKILCKMYKIATGSYITEPFVSYFPIKRIDVNSNPRADLEIDGDIFGTTPATFTVCPHAVQVLIPKSP